MKQYQKISEEELVDKIIRAKNPSDIGYGLNHRERRIPFNEFWNINIDSLVSGFNQIDKIIQNIEYMNEELICDFCGNHFTRLERNASNKSGRHFCSNECGKKYANSFALTPQKRIALSHKMKDLYKQGKIKLPPKTKIDFFVDRYMANPRKCKLCGKIIPYERRYYWSCCKDHEIHGGVRQGSGRGKMGWYHGVWCDSSWELAWVIYQLEHDVQFERYKGFFEYEYEGQIHKYYPDFKLQDGSFVEIKGYSSKQWKSKLDSFPKDKVIQVLYKSDMKPILDYVTSKYGKDFIRLYE